MGHSSWSLHWLRHTPHRRWLTLLRKVGVLHPSLLSSGCYNTHQSHATLNALSLPCHAGDIYAYPKMAELSFSRHF